MPKQLSGAVGIGGRNAPNDVAVVQYLLDCVPASRGGPAPELVIDSMCGPKTSVAIRNFQRANGCPQDGRVEPWRVTTLTLISRCLQWDRRKGKAATGHKARPIRPAKRASALAASKLDTTPAESKQGMTPVASRRAMTLSANPVLGRGGGQTERLRPFRQKWLRWW